MPGDNWANLGGNVDLLDQEQTEVEILEKMEPKPLFSIFLVFYTGFFFYFWK